jgi:lipoprotein-anchoring transpeptidase ErfK/SrfK
LGEDEGARDTMKAVCRLLAAAVVLVVMAAPPAFARSRHPSHADTAPPQSEQPDLQVMSITDAWYPDLIVAPPITRPAGSSYDIPKPQSQWVEVAPAPISVAATGTAPSSDHANASNVEHSSTGSSMEMMTAAVDGRKIDGAAISAPQNGAQIAAANAPSTPKLNSAMAGPPAPSRTPGSILFDATHDDSTLDPANWAVNVFKKQQALIVYYKGRLFKRYDAVFGRALDLGAKQWAQDRRTPEGVYTIIEKYPSARFKWFLRLNYPNLEDRVRYETMKVNGVVPVDADGKSPTVGSAIGIHGTDVPILNSGHINWTTGCISVENNDIDDLDRLLPVGTVVIIKP